MKKLLAFVDTYLLKFGVLCTLAFVALYPKLPSIHIIRTWVYIRLEDFVIAALVIFWLIQLVRRKVRLPLPVGVPLGIYWLAGLCSLVVSLLFVGPHLVGFFPHLAILEYLRRIEYMILFFVAFSTVRSFKDVKDYIVVICLTVFGIVLYGFGQRFYLVAWGLFPSFFEKYPFCFPSFQTGNEEFAKGLALCLPQEARITSTFGGHYDLAAYMVIILPVLLGIFVGARRIIAKVGVGILFVMSLMLLVFTASRVSFIAYLIGAAVALVAMKKKWLLIPVVVVSIACLVIFSGSTAKRFLETFRVVNVVTNNQGQVVGLAANNLPDSLKNKISKNDSVVVEAPPPTQNLPTGSSFITISNTAVATSNAYVKAAIPTSESVRLKLANGGIEISTVSGNFLIQKALVYDISFTTRFQGEWPNAWSAFMSDPAFGKGYSTITLATDNDYLRFLGESGVFGFLSFALIFVVFAIFLRAALAESPLMVKLFALGLAGGVVGLFMNASLIDVFESSKVAESLWILLGIGVGALSLTFNGNASYIHKIKKILSSHIILIVLLCTVAFIMFGGGLGNFFVADDFIWLKWAAVAQPSDLLRYFVNAQGSIYRPIAQLIMFGMYSAFNFQPAGYHVVGLLLHCGIGVVIYVLGLLVFKKKLWAFLMALLYIILPIHAEVLFWISTISISWATFFMLTSLTTFVYFRQRSQRVFYGISLLFALLSLFTFEMGVVLPLLLLTVDVLVHKKVTKQALMYLIPYVIFDSFYLTVRSMAHVASGGDYSYSIVHFVPNVIANYINYVLTTFIGERVVAWQYGLRLILKAQAFPVTMLLVVLVGLVGVAGYFMYKRINKELLQYGIFGLVFAFVALLPFLDLGNISERYGYLGALGFVFVVIGVAKYLVDRQKGKLYIQSILALIGIAFFFFSLFSINRELGEWKKASTVTYNTLAYFKVVKQYVATNTTFYVSHLPTKYGNAWIFPVGLQEGLWFIYRDDSLRIVKTESVDSSLAIKHSHPSKILNNEFVFDFDKNGNILQY